MSVHPTPSSPPPGRGLRPERPRVPGPAEAADDADAAAAAPAAHRQEGPQERHRPGRRDTVGAEEQWEPDWRHYLYDICKAPFLCSTKAPIWSLQIEEDQPYKTEVTRENSTGEFTPYKT